jgi:hypothetical protein
MAYEEDITNFPVGFNGSQEFPVNNLNPIQFSQIFNGVPQLYAGSSFTVEEVIEFGVLINNQSAIDVDYRWYPPKKYMGTWTIFDQLSVFGTYPEDRGFIEDDITKVRRYSTYVIQANADIPIAVHEQSAIDDCNFELGSVQIGVPPVTVEGSRLTSPEAVLKSRHTLSRVPLLDRPFIGRIKTIGLYVDLGCELTFVNYKARVINGISVDLPEFPLTVCSNAPTDIACQLAFNASLLLPPEFPGSNGVRYTTLEQAETVKLTLPNPEAAIIYQQAFNCPVPPYTAYPYYVLIGGM